MIDKLIKIGRCYGMEMNVEKTKVMKIKKKKKKKFKNFKRRISVYKPPTDGHWKQTRTSWVRARQLSAWAVLWPATSDRH
jgi:hypothetical protein